MQGRSPTIRVADTSSKFVRRVPPQAFFVVSAVFHYLGPAFAVLLFSAVAPLGVAWLRITSAALIFAVWRRPWRLWRKFDGADRRTIVGLAVSLAAMNACFYLAIARLPLATVGAIEFLGPIALAAIGMRGPRNALALALAVGGVALLTTVRFDGEPLGVLFAFLNCALFVLYVVLGHRIAGAGSSGGIDRLAQSMLAASVVAAPAGLADAAPASASATVLLAAIGVGVTSSVIPYVADQFAMSRLPRASFALMLSLLPATATAIGLLMLRQVPTPADLIGIGLVVAAVALHRPKLD